MFANEVFELKQLQYLGLKLNSGGASERIFSPTSLGMSATSLLQNPAAPQASAIRIFESKE